jgi:2-iminobutanoate/2-iminopropanoate deaminase
MQEKVAIVCPSTPQAIGPYAQGIKVGNMVFISGQIPIHPQTGEVVGKDIAQQTEVVLRFLEAILAQVEATVAHVVKTTVYMTDLSQFAEMNAIYAKHFDYNPPARATVEVSRLPKGVMIEIDAIAMLPQRKEHAVSMGI